MLVNVLTEELPWWSTHSLDGSVSSEETVVSKSQTYYTHILDKYICQTLHILEVTLPPNERNDVWRVWHSLMVGDDLVLERGEDFRILEFERRSNNGEWSI